MHHTYKNWWNECLPFIHTWHILPDPSIHLPPFIRALIHPIHIASTLQNACVHKRAYVHRIKRVLTYIDTNTHSNHAMQANVSEEEGRFFLLLQHIEKLQSTTQKLAALGTPMINCRAVGFRSVPCQSHGIDRKQDRSRRSGLHRSNVVHGWKMPRNLVGQTSKPLALAT